MSANVQALFFGLACAIFVFAFIISLVKPPPDPANRVVSLDWKALGLAVWVFVPFIIALRAGA